MTRLPGSASGPCFADHVFSLAPTNSSTRPRRYQKLHSSPAAARLRAGPTSSPSALIGRLRPPAFPATSRRFSRRISPKAMNALPIPEQKALPLTGVPGNAGTSVVISRYRLPALLTAVGRKIPAPRTCAYAAQYLRRSQKNRNAPARGQLPSSPGRPGRLNAPCVTNSHRQPLPVSRRPSDMTAVARRRTGRPVVDPMKQGRHRIVPSYEGHVRVQSRQEFNRQ